MCVAALLARVGETKSPHGAPISHVGDGRELTINRGSPAQQTTIRHAFLGIRAWVFRAAVGAGRQDENMSITRVRARLATTHPIPAYGGVQLPRQVLDQVASAVASGAMPMHLGHDISRPIAVADVLTGIEQLDDGHFAVWAEFDVDAEVWAAHESEVAAAGAPGGMSISFTGPLAGRSLASDSPLVVAADGHHFDDVEIDSAAAILGRLGVDAGGEVLYQFSFEPVAKVIIDVVWPVVMSLGPNLVASAIYDAARSFFRPGRSTVVFNICFKETRRGARRVKVHIEASNETELSAALDRLPDVLRAGTDGTFVSRAGSSLEILAPGADAQMRGSTDLQADN